MLVLTRKTGESLLLGNDVKIVISRISGGRVRLAIEAPEEVKILREELTREKDNDGWAGPVGLTIGAVGFLAAVAETAAAAALWAL